MKILKPSPSHLSEYFKSYLHYIPEEDLMQVLREQKEVIENFVRTIPRAKETFRYAEGKWMLKEIFGHLCDTERVFLCRALWMARNDKTPLPGFDENYYMTNSNYRDRSLKNIMEELLAVRASTTLLFENMSEEMFDRKGTANNSDVTARGILFFIVAHMRHHLGVIKERYLN